MVQRTLYASEVFEVEHTTNIHGALLRFLELQDFTVKFRIVAAKEREPEFNDKFASNTFSPLHGRVIFYDYDKVLDLHTKTMALAEAESALRLFG